MNILSARGNGDRQPEVTKPLAIRGVCWYNIDETNKNAKQRLGAPPPSLLCTERSLHITTENRTLLIYYTLCCSKWQVQGRSFCSVGAGYGIVFRIQRFCLSRERIAGLHFATPLIPAARLTEWRYRHAQQNCVPFISIDEPKSLAFNTERQWKFDHKEVYTLKKAVLLALITALSITACTNAPVSSLEPDELTFDSETDERLNFSSSQSEEPEISETDSEGSAQQQEEDNEIEKPALDIAPIEEKEISADSVQMERQDGYLDNISDFKYSFIPPIKGRYRFELTEMRADLRPWLYIYDQYGEEIVDGRMIGKNGGGYTLWGMEGGEPYKIVLAHPYAGITPSPTGSFVLNIYYQKPPLDLSGYTQLNDSVEFQEQRNVYSFTPDRDGVYRFEISDMMAGTELKLILFDQYEETVDERSVRKNHEGLTVQLEKGHPYEFQIRQEENSSPYTLHIGMQKPETDISNVMVVNDSIQFTDQSNLYAFTAPEENVYFFSLSEMQSDSDVDLYAFNRLNEALAQEENCNNGSFILVALEEGETAYLQVRQRKGLSNYRLTCNT